MAVYHSNTPDTVYIPPPPLQVTPTRDIDKIREWLPWSILNIFIGWGVGGIIPLVFTLLCRQRKQANDLKGAQTMSTLALIFNIIITLSGLAGWISLIILIVYARKIYHGNL